MSRSSKRLFLKKFIAQPAVNASIIPSSQALARLMIQDIDRSSIGTVVEFGPGTWVFTQHILAHLVPWSKLILIEFDPDYCSLLQDMFGDQVMVICWDVHDFPQIIKHHHLHPDLIISWLPYFPFEWHAGETLLRYIKSLLDHWCVMRWFSYSPRRYHNTYKILHPKLVDYTLSCIPPAFVYEMKN